MKTSSKSQIDKFREAAQELKADEDEGRFNSLVGKIAKSPPPTEAKEKPKKPAK